MSAIFAEVFSSASGGTTLADAFGAALRRDPLIAAAVIAGACGFLFVRSGTEDDGRRPFWYAALALGFIALYRRTNPFMYPYAMIMLAPLCAPLVSGVRNFYRTAKARALIDGLVIALVCIVAAGSGVQAYELASSRTNRQQRAFIEWLWSATTPSEQIFDWQGLHFGRRGIPHWWTYGGVLPRYQKGWYTLEQEIRAARVTLLIPNYRFGWLTENDQQFLANHYIADSACTLTPGFLLEDPTTPRRIEVLVDGEYDIAADEALLIDGQLRRDFSHLTRGWHLVSAVPESRAERIALVYTTPLRAKRRPPCDQDTVLLYGF